MAMTPEEHMKQMHAAAEKGDWDTAIAHAKQTPKNWSAFDQLPQYKIPPHAFDKVIDATPKNDRGNFLFELSGNLHPDLTGSQLNKLSAYAGEDHIVNTAVQDHPNYGVGVEGHEGDLAATEFWRSYERDVTPHHFATVKSMSTGKPESLNHRGKEGRSHESSYIREGRLFDDVASLKHLPDDFSKYKAYGFKTESVIPHLHTHAKKVQDRILNDSDIEKKYKDGKLHIKVYRGVAGNYADKIATAAGFDRDTHTAKNKTLKVSALPFHSWSLDKQVARGFADRDDLSGHAAGEHKVVMSAWVPLENILHSGMHVVHPGQTHAHPQEQELIVAHPEGNMKIKTSDMEFGHPQSPNPMTRKATIVSKPKTRAA